MRAKVRSLALLSWLRIQCCCELWCRSYTWLGSCIAVAVVWARSYSSDLNPSLGTSICRGCRPKSHSHSPNKKRERERRDYFMSLKKINHQFEPENNDLAPIVSHTLIRITCKSESCLCVSCGPQRDEGGRQVQRVKDPRSHYEFLFKIKRPLDMILFSSLCSFLFCFVLFCFFPNYKTLSGSGGF